MNGFNSFLKYGADNAYGGLFDPDSARGRPKNTESKLGDYNYADGFSQYEPASGLDSSAIVDELATLLTSGRLSRETRKLLKSVFEEYSGAEAYINVQQIIAMSPEFNTNGLARSTGTIRPTVERGLPSERPYKAVVQIHLAGGWDSFNVLVPAECQGKNAAGETVDKQYTDVRGELAIRMHQTDLRIDVDKAQGQPCRKFAIHRGFPIAKELWDDGSLIFLANTGVIDSAEMTKQTYNTVTVSGLFSHSDMQEAAERVDPFSIDAGTGILGRMSTVLEEEGYRTATISIDSPSSATSGSTVLPIVASRDGATKFNERPRKERKFQLQEHAAVVNAETDTYSNLFGKMWSAEYSAGVDEAGFFSEALDKTALQKRGSGKVAHQMEMVARLMQTKDDRGVDRDLFFIKSGFWDHHANLVPALENGLTELDTALRNFVDELKAQDAWDDTIIVVTSDFGRSLTLNGREGSDHAWGGHYMLMGGGIDGGKILGQYPDDLTEAGPLNIGRGRIMPTMSWDAVWNGVSEWAGVTENEMERVLPNLKNSYGPGFASPLKQSDLFRRQNGGGNKPSKKNVRGADVFGK